jgi:hypothetical protein
MFHLSSRQNSASISTFRLSSRQKNALISMFLIHHPSSKTLLFPLFGEIFYYKHVPIIAKKGKQQRLAHQPPPATTNNDKGKG